MEDINLGKKVQDFRNKSGMSLLELAKRAGLTASMLSQIERDLVNPSIGTLKAIAQALDVPMFKFFKDDEPQVQMIVRRGENKTIGHPDADLAYTLLTPDVRGSIEFCMMSIPPGLTSGRNPEEHVGEEVAYVVRGSVGINVAGISYQLEEGDSIRIPPQTAHQWMNQGGTVVQVIFAITPPSF